MSVEKPIQVHYPLPKVKVEVLLDPKQKIDHNKWLIHIEGEERIVTQQSVVWFVYTRYEAARSFDLDEVWSFNISLEKEALRNHRNQP